ncbi:immunoglobulin-binding protein 1 [Heteronotia binoei]|uniref:immunoglobulin-binding protein 1 n=1 Tax=Heteronotia binoei TaxID=13085 RepID=UPI002930B90C|nr:immunoglobulin-binding protein 1 [Heteronotia binoei]
MAAASAAEEEAAPGSSAEGSEPLWELLRGGWRLLEEVEGSTEPSSGAPALQAKVRRGIALLERAAHALAQLDLFSRQEELEEVASADLRFMLVPALLGALVLRQTSPPGADLEQQRLQHLRRARDSFLAFLRLCRDYGLHRGALPPAQDPQQQEAPDPPPAAPRPQQAALVAMAAARQAKIERYKQKKEAENRLAALKACVESGQAEEEQIREYYLLQISMWVTVSLEEIESIDQEIAVLSRRDALKQGAAATQPSRAPRPPMKPFLLTRDAAQAKVFGAGYPSLATMSVDEWYEQHRKRGALPDQGISQTATGGTEEQQKDPEEGQAKEEEEAVRKAREWDDWKDTHPRGYGNRKNMG